MDVPGPANKSICRHGSGEDGDRISSLPQGLIEHILTFLPLGEAVKTSILSTAWRNKWVNRPSLIFDEDFWTPFPVGQTSAQFYGAYGVFAHRIERLTSNVFRVLCFHTGPLREFSICIPQLSNYPALVDQIMLFLCGKSIERLCIKIDGYMLPSRLFSFRQLEKLQLSGCMFNSSQISFEEFSMLTCLELRSVKFPYVAGISLAIRCPLLLVLTMKDCGFAFNRLDILIEAPSLRLFHCVGSFSSLWVKEAPFLKDVTVHQTASFVDYPKSKDERTNFMKLCSGCPAVERLSIAIELLKDLATPTQMSSLTKLMMLKQLGLLKDSATPTQMSSLAKLMMLKQLRLDEMCLSFVRDVWGCLYLIERSPNLQELIIGTTIRANPNVDRELRIIQQVCESRNYRPNRLEKIELNQLQGSRSEMYFIRWLLSVSPVLDKLEIEFSANMLPSDQIQTLKELNGFHRPSTKAQVIIK